MEEVNHGSQLGASKLAVGQSGGFAARQLAEAYDRRGTRREVIMTGEAAQESGIDAVIRYLEEQGVTYEVVDHDRRFTAAAEARAAGMEPDHAAKTVALRDDRGYRLAVVPASERVDLRKVRELLEGPGQPRLATEDEMRSDFPAFEVGALPPLGPMLPAAEIFDRRLLEHDRILCSGGDHRHSVLIDPREVARLSNAQLADICED
jgi:Ala-tRNA(Pro) deacylase